MDSGFDDWVYWHFFTITVDYIELLLNDVYLTNLPEESLTDLLNSRMNSLLYLPRDPNISHHVEQLFCLLSRE
jgi:hypothetical protein